MVAAVDELPALIAARVPTISAFLQDIKITERMFTNEEVRTVWLMRDLEVAPTVSLQM